MAHSIHTIIAYCLFAALVTTAMPVDTGYPVDGAQPTNEMIIEYLALAPQGPKGSKFTTMKWVELSYPKGVTSADDVSIKAVNTTQNGKGAPSEIGAWYDLDTVNGFSLTGKIVGDKLYAYIDQSGEGFGGCCADTFRTYNKTDGSFSDLNLNTIIAGAMPNMGAFASHTFDVKEVNGEVVAYAMVRYSDKTLGSIYADAIVAFSVVDGTIIPTADGDKAWVVSTNAGEEKSGTDKASAIFKIQYFNGANTQHGEQWHGNGIDRFTSKGGTTIMAMTHRFLNEAILFKDPFTYKKVNGGGNILQRFGTPQQYSATFSRPVYHYFGVNPYGKMGYVTGGVHNVYYNADSPSFPGRQSVSMFVNSASGTGKAYAMEFVIKLTEEVSGTTYDDTVFATDYVAAELTFSAFAQGGARAIGKGVLLAMSGADATGLEVADVNGKSHSYAYPGYTPSTGGGGGPGSAPQLYDPFIFVRKGSK